LREVDIRVISTQRLAYEANFACVAQTATYLNIYQHLSTETRIMTTPPASTKTFVVGVRFKGSVLERLRARAEAERRSVSTLAGMLVEDALDQEPGAPASRSAGGRMSRPGVQEPPSAPAPRLETSTDLQAIGVVTTINEELRREGHTPLTGNTYTGLCRLLSTVFRDVRDLAGARAKGPTQWLNAGALPGLIRALYPDDLGAVAMAKKAQNAVQMKRKLATASELQQFISARGIVGQGAVALRRIIAQHFPGMTISEAIKQGPDVWLDAGIGEENARRLFNEKTAVEARRRAYVMGNASKKAPALQRQA